METERTWLKFPSRGKAGEEQVPGSEDRNKSNSETAEPYQESEWELKQST